MGGVFCAWESALNPNRASDSPHHTSSTSYSLVLSLRGRIGYFKMSNKVHASLTQVVSAWSL